MTVIEQRDMSARIDASLALARKCHEEMTLEGKQTILLKQLLCAATQGLCARPDMNPDDIPELSVKIAKQTMQKFLTA
jgi:hypothetical protein